MSAVLFGVRYLHINNFMEMEDDTIRHFLLKIQVILYEYVEKNVFYKKGKDNIKAGEYKYAVEPIQKKWGPEQTLVSFYNNNSN